MTTNGQPPSLQKLAQVNEQTWLQLGEVAEMMLDYDRAMNAYESALRQNAYSIQALGHIAALCRAREQFPRAVEYFNRILNIDQTNGEIWGALGHCYLMMDDLQKAYSAYQQALYHLPNPKEPKLWYGIGILYDRYGSLDHAEEAFSQVMSMEPKFEKANEIYFRLGIIYKQQHKYEMSLGCFKYILHNPPRPLTEVDIWFQIGHVYEQQKNYTLAKEAYERVLTDNPNHAKVLQQLGWLYHQQNANFGNQDMAIQYLTKSLESDGNDAQSWYLLGRCYMAQQKYNKAYEAYQQAVYRDGRNPTFWCSIGVLYYQINQFRDALDAYSRAIRLNPYISEVWYDLGTLYESCNNQISDALDAYQRAHELDQDNPHIKQRLQMLRNQQQQGGQTTAPVPQDVNPQAYNNSPSMMSNPPPPQFAHPTPGPPGPPGMPGLGGYGRMDNRQSHPPPPPLPVNFPNNVQGSGRDLPPMNTGRRSPAPQYNHPLPPHIRGEPTTPPNHHNTLSPMMPPSQHDNRQLGQQSQPPPPPQTTSQLRMEKRPSPSPQMPPISESRSSRGYSPQLPEPQSSGRQPYTLASPKLPGPEQYSPPILPPHQSSHQQPHSSHSVPHHDILHDRREEIYDPTKVKGEDKHNDSSMKPEDTSVDGVSNNIVEHGPSRVPPQQILNASPPPPLDHAVPLDHVVNHRIPEQSVDDEKVGSGNVVPPIHTFRSEDMHDRRRSNSINLPEIKASEPSTPRTSIPHESPQQPPQHLSRVEHHKPNILNDETSPRSPPESRSPDLSRILDNNGVAATPDSPLDTVDNVKHPSSLGNFRTTPPNSSDRNIINPPVISTSTSSRQVDEDYDDTADVLVSMSEVGASSSTSPVNNSSSPTGQKRPYSPPKGDIDTEDRAREDVPTKKKRDRDRDRDRRDRDWERDREQRERERERRKSEQSGNSGNGSNSP
ncbi:2155_t:CDS:10 [Ambispora leptoticha]|uniref:2155_t:CDS:1 n=1 Tax=Ambispora leptoticha TaxID=144679 RepID=A0A9N8YR54_9GLOM|nr:2155_t:CDS:10 [Ambispora leptoticha]